MKGKKTVLVVLVAVSLLVVAAVGANAVFAKDGKAYPPIVKKLADRFKLDVGEVGKVFDEEAEARHKEKSARFEARLDQAVKDGKITEAQKSVILKKESELKDTCEKNRDLSPEERREAMKSARQDLQDWAKKNDIDLKLLGGIKGGPGMFGPGHRGQGPKGGFGLDPSGLDKPPAPPTESL